MLIRAVGTITENRGDGRTVEVDWDEEWEPVDFNRSLKQMAFPKGQAHCHFHTFTSNITKNQIIRSTLHAMAMSGRFGNESRAANDLRHELRSLIRNLEHIDLIQPVPETVRRQLQQRDDRDCRLMLLICDMIVRHQMPTQLTGGKQLYSVDLSWKFVWRVFERFSFSGRTWPR